MRPPEKKNTGKGGSVGEPTAVIATICFEKVRTSEVKNLPGEQNAGPLDAVSLLDLERLQENEEQGSKARG